MDLGMYFGVLLAVAAMVSLLANGVVKMLGYMNSLLYGLTLAILVGIFCVLFTCALPLAESRRDSDKDLLFNLVCGLGCFSGLVSVHRDKGAPAGTGSK